MTPVCYCKTPDVVRPDRDEQGRARSPYCRKCGHYWAPEYGSKPDPTGPAEAPAHAD